MSESAISSGAQPIIARTTPTCRWVLNSRSEPGCPDARNKMRLYNVTQEKVEEVITSGERLSRGDKWESQHGGLKVIWLMVGSYALVVTVIKTRKR